MIYRSITNIIPFETITNHYEITITVNCKEKYSLLETASNLSDFLFRFHFHGLSNFPIENLLFLSAGGVLVPLPRLFVRNADPFCFLAEKERENNIKSVRFYIQKII